MSDPRKPNHVTILPLGPSLCLLVWGLPVKRNAPYRREWGHLRPSRHTSFMCLGNLNSASPRSLSRVEDAVNNCWGRGLAPNSGGESLLLQLSLVVAQGRVGFPVPMLLEVTLTNVSKSNENSGHQLDSGASTLISPALAHCPHRAQAICHASPALCCFPGLQQGRASSPSSP